MGRQLFAGRIAVNEGACSGISRRRQFETGVGRSLHIRCAAVAAKQHDEHQGNESEQGDRDCGVARHSPLWPIGSVVLEVHQRFSPCRS
jgi:hypothetical protein